MTPPDVEHHISHRVKRQAILYRDKPTPYTAIVHKAALRMRFGGPGVARGQLQHILDMSEHAHIKVLVIPFEAGSFPGSGPSILYSIGPVPQMDTVQLDTEHGSELLDAPAQLGGIASCWIAWRRWPSQSRNRATSSRASSEP
ncbi:DUF5753 domain-containing protein [Streptomyces sp. NPDC127074]|uniref:DUF5753 domain-containing protein n=1 Tax=Streptomyces sp. NPDC127074 TaxID=3347130 RepID=UPI00364CB336